MSSHLIKLVAAAATIAATPIMAEAQTLAYAPSSPVEIVAFDAVHTIPWTGAGTHPALVETFAGNFEPSHITLRFVNRSPVPATSVTFVVNKGGDSRSIVDKGNFRQGVLIEHTFDGYVGSSGSSPETCAVAEVDFADGTAWHTTDADSDVAADSMKSRRAELEQQNADARRIAFRHLGTSL